MEKVNFQFKTSQIQTPISIISYLPLQFTRFRVNHSSEEKRENDVMGMCEVDFIKQIWNYDQMYLFSQWQSQ